MHTRILGGMGWDCYATRNYEEDAETFGLTDDDLAAFKEVADALRATGCEFIDADLATGGLNLSGCGDAIERLTDFNAWAEEPATPEDVTREARDWGEIGKQDDPYEANAAAFLRVCVDRGLGIYWSW